MRLAPRPALAAVALLLFVSLGASGCSGDEDTPPGESSSSAPPLPTGDPSEFQIETHTTIGKVVGRLPKDARRRLPDKVTDVVQRWFNAAYVGGEYPRSNFSDAFPGFTPGARNEAERDKGLLTNRNIGRNITGVTPTRSRLLLDILAVRKRPVAVTARFRLGFRTEGRERVYRVKGSLRLVHRDAGWKIFAYDVSKEGRKA